MHFLILICAFLFVAYLLKYYKSYFLNYNTIPGPSPWLSFPVIGELCPVLFPPMIGRMTFSAFSHKSIPVLFAGHSWLFGSDPIKKVFDLKREYGDVIRFDIGFLPSVILTKYEDVSELFKMEAFAGRAWSLYPHMATLLKSKTKDGNYEPKSH